LDGLASGRFVGVELLAALAAQHFHVFVPFMNLAISIRLHYIGGRETGKRSAVFAVAEIPRSLPFSVGRAFLPASFCDSRIAAKNGRVTF
jgi:hypothetical protein